jgi:hypothetical protein
MARNLADLIPAVFTGPNGQPLTEDQIRSRQLIARTLLQNATDTSPNAGGWASVLAKGVQGFASGYQNRAADRGAQAATQADSDLSSALLGSLSGGSTAIPAPGAASEVPVSPYASTPVTASGEIADYIRQSAAARGIDPDIALRVAQSEGGLENPVNQSSVIKNGVREQSYGPFQLYLGGGLGNKALEAGIDPRDPNQWRQGVDFALDQAKAGGWGPWYGAKKLGITGMAGIGNAPVQVASAAPQTATDAIAAVSPTSGYSDPTVTTAYAQPAPTPVTSSPLPDVGPVSAEPQAPPVSPVAQALAAPVKGDRLGVPTSQNFNDRFGASPAAPAVTPDIYSQPGDFLRPFNANERRPNADGSYSTEISTTWQLPDGKWTNVPSLWMGPNGPQQFNPDDEENILGAASSYEMRNGQTFSRFPSEQAAVQAAEARSAAGGAGSGQSLVSQTAPAIPQPQLPTVPPLNPAVIKALSSPYASPQTKQVASALLQQHQQQVQSVQEQRLKIQQQQQALQQRQSVAQRLNIDPTLAADDDAWKQALSAQSTGGGIINAGDGNLYNSRTGEWLSSPGAGNKNFRQATPEEVKAYGTNGQVGPDNKFYPVTPPQGTSLNVGPNGELSFNQGAGVKPLTEGQSKDTFFQTRMSSALPTLEANEDALLNLGGKVADAIPMNLGNYAQTEQYQLARDAGRDFVTAYLRKDSGAAIQPAEEKLYGELLLPQPGDKPTVIEAKRQRRRVAVEAIKSGMPQQALDNAMRAIKASGGDKAIVPTEIPGVTIRRKN